ncbi:hypothetical protein CEXT_644211 [Caerostris extrusa]|uniref:Uncharacterized protein n=1 Tax=Caerostris extrusa TaxID=172846 RepID=A0AAV4RUT4_CAEEX|nr:hypothetical protein CEXT_644211 [Caerostris extrusa]
MPLYSLWPYLPLIIRFCVPHMMPFCVPFMKPLYPIIKSLVSQIRRISSANEAMSLNSSLDFEETNSHLELDTSLD